MIVLQKWKLREVGINVRTFIFASLYFRLLREYHGDASKNKEENTVGVR